MGVESTADQPTVALRMTDGSEMPIGVHGETHRRDVDVLQRIDVTDGTGGVHGKQSAPLIGEGRSGVIHDGIPDISGKSHHATLPRIPGDDSTDVVPEPFKTIHGSVHCSHFEWHPGGNR